MQFSTDSNKIVLKVVIGVIIIALIIFGSVILIKKYNFSSGDSDIKSSVDEETKFENSSIGKSVEGRLIDSYTFGNGSKHVVFVGGIHGGYEWNSVFLAYKFIDYLKSNPDFVPDNLKVTVIPSANPDGLYKVIGKSGRFNLEDVPIKEEDTVSGRFNANNVDLNRNFGCKWKPESTWRGAVVNAGDFAFSEPESLALKNFVSDNNPDAFVFWHSKSGAVYGSECEDGILPETLSIMNYYSKASGYKSVPVFDAYEITGDAEGWLASIGIPAITVELKTHESIEWEQNLVGARAVLDFYNK